MRTIVIYRSRTGFTKRYAEWIAEDLGCETAEYRDFRSVDLQNYDLIIYGGRVHAGKIDNLDRIRNRLSNTDQKLVVFATGATPLAAKGAIEKVMRSNFPDSAIPHFYMQSGLCYEKMGLVDRTIMKALSKMLAKKSEKSEIDDGTADAIRESYDISDRSYIQPLIEYVTGMQRNAEDRGQ